MAGQDLRVLKASSKILILDDRPAIAHQLKELLEREGFKQVSCSSSVENFSILDNDYDLIICDIVWPWGTRPVHVQTDLYGFEVMEYVLANLPDTKIILFSGCLYDLDDLIKVSKAHGYFSIRSRPIDIVNTILRVLTSEDAALMEEETSTEPNTATSMLKDDRFQFNVSGPVTFVAGSMRDIKVTVSSKNDLVEILDLLEKTVVQAVDDGWMKIEKNTFQDLMNEIQQLKLEAVKNKPDRSKFRAFIEKMTKHGASIVGLLGVLDKIVELVRKLPQ